LSRSIKQIGIINREIEMAVKILETINKKVQVTDVQQIYTTDWAQLTNRAWHWIGNIQDTFVRPTYQFDYMKYTPFQQPCSDPLQNELGLYLNGDIETYKYEPIDLQCVKEYENLKNPPNAHELFMKAYKEDMKRMKEQEEHLKNEREEMKQRLKLLDERATMHEGDEDEERLE
jgi:hypothetical protein